MMRRGIGVSLIKILFSLSFLSKFFVEHKKLRFANAKRSHGFYSSNGVIKTLFSSSYRVFILFEEKNFIYLTFVK
jgi:hypothetical protein